MFDNETDYLVQFRGLVSNSAALTLTLNATDNTIEIDFDDAALVADIPDATTTQRGILETATNAEALAKAALDKILTPSNLAALGASLTFAGLAEFATDAETIAGVSSSLAVTPAGLLAASPFYSPVVFADAVARAAGVPAFKGQFAFQADNGSVWTAADVIAGSFTRQIANEDNDIQIVGAPGVTWSVPGGWSIDGTGGGTLEFANFTSLTFIGNGFIIFDSQPVEFAGTTAFSANVDFDTNARIQDNGVDVPASSVLTTSSTAGQFNSSLITTFVSSANTNTGWTAFTNSAVLKTGDCNTLTLPQLAQIVDTLIGTLRNVLLPAV